MLDITEHKANLEDAIQAHARGNLNTLDRKDALIALIVGAPCVINTGGYHNQAAGRIACLVNQGADLGALVREFAKDRGGRSLARSGEVVLSALYGVNDRGREAIEAARWALADEVA